LIEFDGQTLLQRHLDALRALGIEEVILCVGFQAEQVQRELDSLNPGITTRTVRNPDYERGSVLSLWTLRGHLSDGEDILVMDADVLYDLRVLERLVKTTIPNCFLLDRDFEAGDEPVKLCVRGGGLVEFRKQVDPNLAYDFSGESVGFFRFSGAMAGRLTGRLEDYVTQDRRDEHYEEAIRDLLLARPEEFGFEDVTGLPWIEIDFHEDVERARREILPSLGKTG
jgi:choline kinase